MQYIYIYVHILYILHFQPCQRRDISNLSISSFYVSNDNTSSSLRKYILEIGLFARWRRKGRKRRASWLLCVFAHRRVSWMIGLARWIRGQETPLAAAEKFILLAAGTESRAELGGGSARLLSRVIITTLSSSKGVETFRPPSELSLSLSPSLSFNCLFPFLF